MWARFVVWLANLGGKPQPKPEPHGKCKAAVDAWLASRPADIPAQPLNTYLITFRNNTVLIHRAHHYRWLKDSNLRFFRNSGVTFQPAFRSGEYRWEGTPTVTESFVCRTASVLHVELIDSLQELAERNH